LTLLNNPDVNARLSLAVAIFLNASISEVSNKIASAIDESLSKQEKAFLCQKFAVIQCKVSALQRGVSNSTASNPANNSAACALDNNDQHEADDFTKLIWHQGEEGGHQGMEKPLDSPREMVSSGAMYALSSFHRQLHSDILCSSTQLINIIILYSLLRYLTSHSCPNLT